MSTTFQLTKWSFFRMSILFGILAFILNKKLDPTEINLLLFHPEHAHYSINDFMTSTANRLFEGWYYKIASKEFQLAVIPGAYHNKHESYSFIFYITPTYSIEYRYPIQSYHTPDKYNNNWHLSIEFNNFSRNSLSLLLKAKDIYSIQPTNFNKDNTKNIKFDLIFKDQDNGFPVSLFQLGAMGYYGWIPFLECYHGILSMNFNVYGKIEIGKDIVYEYNEFLEDKNNSHYEIAHGYLEKDWGTNFPQTWVWIQANHFNKDENVSLTLALARLPIIGDSLLTKAGFLGGLYFNNELIVLSTYNWCNVDVFHIIDNHLVRSIHITISNFWNTQTLKVIATIPNAYNISRKEAMKIYPHLLVPQSNGVFEPTLMEWTNANTWIRYEDNDKGIMFESDSYPATVECHSDDNMEYMLTNFGK